MTASRYVRSRPDIMLVMGVVFSAGTFGLNFQMTTALMATEVYGKGAGEYGILGSIVAIGSLAGALLAARRTTSRQRLVVVSGVAFGAVTMVAGLMPTYLTFALILPVCGFAALTLITAANAFVQMAADPRCAAGSWRCTWRCSWAARRSAPRCSAGSPSRGRPLDPDRRWRPHRDRHRRRRVPPHRQGLVITRYVWRGRHRQTDYGPVVVD